jgi:UPF0755 protein
MIRKLILTLIALGILAGLAIGGYIFYRVFYAPALQLPGDEAVFYIHTGWSEKEVMLSLNEKGWLAHPDLAEKVMERKNYQGGNVVAGKYTLSSEMDLDALVNHLRAGNGEEEVKLTFNSARTLTELAGDVARSIEADSSEVLELLLDPETAGNFGFSRAGFISMFLPDTYRMEWDTDAREFLDRMAKEYKLFWTDERKQKARELGLSQTEVSTLASIVQAEQQLHPDERPLIAGLYLNRLKRGIRLQSDPTVVYAVGDFSINRVLTRHLSTPSPYNTYIHAGLPPGPINIPDKVSIDAVLNPRETDYIYMCAKPDFSGYHAFAETLVEHNRNARAFQKALNERNIYR